MCNTQKNSLLLNQNKGNDAPQNSENRDRMINPLAQEFFFKF